MKIVIALVIFIGGVFVMRLHSMGSQSQQGQIPGLSEDGKLLPCSSKPNCVCSEYNDSQDHYIDPIATNAAWESLLPLIQNAIQAIEGSIVNTQNGYVAAIHQSKLFGFVDDVEFRHDAEAGLLHIRSASRVGYSDLGANRKRAELLKSLIQTAIK